MLVIFIVIWGSDNIPISITLITSMARNSLAHQFQAWINEMVSTPLTQDLDSQKLIENYYRIIITVTAVSSQ